MFHLLHFTLVALFDSSVMLVDEILVQLSDLQSSTVGFLQTVLQSLFGERDHQEPASADDVTPSGTCSLSFFVSLRFKLFKVALSPLADWIDKWRLVTDINALVTVLIAQKTGAVINTTEADLEIQQYFGQYEGQQEVLARIFRSPIFNRPDILIHPDHDLETLGSNAQQGLNLVRFRKTQAFQRLGVMTKLQDFHSQKSEHPICWLTQM